MYRGSTINTGKNIQDMRGKTRQIGKECENKAREYLEDLGFLILERNYRIGKLGEIDIIAKENEYVCFIEVKARSGNHFGRPSEAIVYGKQKTIRKIASMYLATKNLYDKTPVRFDALEMYFFFDESGEVRVKEYNLIKNAF